MPRWLRLTILPLLLCRLLFAPDPPASNDPCVDAWVREAFDKFIRVYATEARWEEVFRDLGKAWARGNQAQKLQLVERMDWALSHLDASEAEAFRLYFGMDGPPQSYREVGGALGISANSATRKVGHALNILARLHGNLGVFDLKRDLSPLMHPSGIEGTPIGLLGFSDKTRRLLIDEGYVTLGQFTSITEKELRTVSGCGPGCQQEVREALTSRGLNFRPEQSAFDFLVSLTPEELWGSASYPARLLPLSKGAENAIRSNSRGLYSIRDVRNNLGNLETFPGIGPAYAAEIEAIIHQLEQKVPIPPN